MGQAAPPARAVQVDEAPGVRPPRFGTPALVVLGLALTSAVLVAAALVGGAARAPELADPGPVTRWGLLGARTAADLAAIGTLGTLVLAVVVLPRSGPALGADLGRDAARLMRAVTWWAAAWASTGLLTALFTLSSTAGAPVAAVLAPDVLPLVLDLGQTRALLSAVWLALLVAVGSRWAGSAATGLLLLVTAGGGVVLPLLTGHAGHGRFPVLTATSLVLHVLAASAWVGGLAALVVHLRRSERALATALPRYSHLALVCFVAVGLSGALTGWASVQTWGQLWSTSYGQLLLAKVAALVLLGAAGHRHRRCTIAAAVRGRPRALLRLAVAELLLMTCAASLAVVLSRTEPPADTGRHALPATQAVPFTAA